MATTEFWPVKSKLKSVIVYAENPDKTMNPKFFDTDLYATLQYAENSNKTDQELFVSGINCSKHNAYAQMVAVKKKFGERGTYNISAKSTPADINSFASLALSYAIGMVLSVVMFFITSDSKNLIVELTKTNWTALALGVAIVALEFGYVCLYRSGWKISVGTLVANISLACVLLVVGILLYKESVSPRQIIGILFSGVGLVLIAK